MCSRAAFCLPGAPLASDSQMHHCTLFRTPITSIFPIASCDEPAVTMGGTVSTGEDNDDLVDKLLEHDCINSCQVERVFRAVDRGHYFTEDSRDSAYTVGRSCHAWYSAYKVGDIMVG